jgi:photosystem II stability/assembly factor-like uncharacterized protein
MTCRLLIFCIALSFAVSDVSSQWINQPMPPIGKVLETSFINAKHGVALGLEGSRPAVVTTIDSTRSWTKWLPATTMINPYGLRSISLSEKGLGWVVGPVGVFRTTDFGITWENDSLALPVDYRPSSSLVVWSVVETSGDWVFIAGCQSGKLALCARSLDPDSSWRVVTLPMEFDCGPDNQFEPYYSQVKGTMSPDGVGLVTIDSDTLIASVSPPFDWTIRSEIQTSLPGFDVRDLMFVDSVNGWMSGDMAYTRDGGRTWTETRASPGVCSTICFVDTTCGWVADGLNVRMTRNGGRSWEYQLPIQRTFALEIVDGDKIYAMGTTFWVANISSLCDSTASSVRDVKETSITARALISDNTLTVDLAGFESLEPITIHVSDILGRSVAGWDAQNVLHTDRNLPTNFGHFLFMKLRPDLLLQSAC